MSKTSDKLEQDLADLITILSRIPTFLTDWTLNSGIKPGAKIINSKRIGATKIKTDVAWTYS